MKIIVHVLRGLIGFIAVGLTFYSALASSSTYIKKYEGPEDTQNVIIFLHGGPGFNSSTFEFSIAKQLSQSVTTIIYDRRLTGRSSKIDLRKVNFASSIEDLSKIIESEKSQI